MPLIFEVWWNSKIIERPITPYADCPFTVGGLSKPTALITGGVITPLSKEISISEMQKIYSMEYTMYIMGHLEYRDVFSSDYVHHQEWCVLVTINDLDAGKFSYMNIFRTAD